MTRVYFETYGCTLNQADTDIMKGIVRNAGYEIAQSEKEADIIVFNTCTVKAATENKIMERMKRTLKPFVISGCIYVNRKRILKEIKNPVVLPPHCVGAICEAIETAKAGRSAWFTNSTEKSNLTRELTTPILRIPIQEGCTGSCYFCQTRLARPRLRSYPLKTIQMWIENGIKAGAREIQITGMDVGAYGLDNGDTLPALLKKIAEIDGNFKIRLGMINPHHLNRFGNELIEIMKSDKFYKFIHLPVQTGSEHVCRTMNRPHSVRDFVSWVNRFRAAIPNITIATDIIVGYPTETERDFMKTISLLKKIKPDVVNISKYTVRTGTKAAEMRHLHTNVIKERSRKITKLVRLLCVEKNRLAIGKTIDVLMLEENGRKGRTKNYKQVVLNRKARLGSWVQAKVERVNHGSLFAVTRRSRQSETKQKRLASKGH
ncbi:MAG: tRNA (N(6)-L-threonylcarbamoyladenosine(37)-C(2))-methylthiotransferase [Candidatus Bilamarchaeaceae archaeon]